jgi:NADPH-dependent ferric siderophore reductase
MAADANPRNRLRREPPRFRFVTVQHVERVTPRLQRVTLGGRDLEGFTVDEPAASVRLLLPSRGSNELVMPEWNGNEFLSADGTRPTIRTLTPRRVVADPPALDVEVVVHGAGAASAWAEGAAPGAVAAISGPGRGYAIDVDAPAFVLAGDETAIPAISELLGVLPSRVPVQVHVEIARPDARLEFAPRAQCSVAWHDLPAGTPPGAALVAAVRAADIVTGARVWVAGEAAAVQRIRRHLFDERAVPRAHASVRGYWKHGRSGEADTAQR